MTAKNASPKRTYADRAASGRPTVSYTLSKETIEMVKRLAAYHRLPQSRVIELAVRELDGRRTDPET